jgi:CO/xanthine dehydrogenase Mo-binding subunit
MKEVEIVRHNGIIAVLSSHPDAAEKAFSKIKTVLIDDPNSAPKGGGEPAIMLVGAVIANAVYDAVGVRLFQLPMTPERVKNDGSRTP